MKITDVKVNVLKTHSIFVRVYTHEGIVGIGECSPMNAQVLATFVEHALKPCLLGKNPLEIEKRWNEMFFRTYKLGVMGAQTEAIAGVDIALWDILGKYTRLPVYTLLGGSHHEKIKMYSSIGGGGFMTPAEMTAKVEEALEQGFKAIKIRMDWGTCNQDANPEKDCEMFKQARKLVGDNIPLSFDANNGYSVKTAIKQGRKFEELGISHYEEPLPQYDYDGYRQVVEALDVPISAGEHEYTRWQFKDLIEKARVDAIQPDVVKCGGITEMKKIAMLGEMHNKQLLPHQTQPTIGNAASLHVCVSMLNFNYPHELSTPYWKTLDELFAEPYKFEDGYMVLPDRPGLGLELDEEKLEAFTISQT